MGYMHIDNLYKHPEFFVMFKDQLIYALEKIHGTSAWLHFNDGQLTFHSGGEKGEVFRKLFDAVFIEEKLKELCDLHKWKTMKIHGEAYGGRMQKMAATYGNKSKFIVFDVRVDGIFLPVEDAEAIAKSLNLEFVYYEKGPNTIEWITQQTAKPSNQAIRNGIQDNPKLSEGIVIRPLAETSVFDEKRGKQVRVIYKNKNEPFWEIASARPLHHTGAKPNILDKPIEIVNEWVTPERFSHVIDHVLSLNPNPDQPLTIKDMSTILDSMVEDVYREGEGELIPSNETTKYIKAKTAVMFKQYLQSCN
jgi:hypothetical protein